MHNNLFLWLLLLPLFLYACTSNIGDERRDSEQSSMPISFDLTKPDGWNGISSSRGEGNSFFSKGDEIGVFAYYNESSTPDFMNNQEVQCNDDKGTSWSYSPVKYWPQNGSMRFYGYFPYGRSSISIDYDKTNAQPILHYENPQMDVDLLAASCAKVSCPYGSPVSLIFKHLLSKINFSFTYKKKNTDNNMAYEPVIHMVQFGNIPYKGDFAFQFDEKETPVWESIDAETTAVRRFTEDVNGVVIKGDKFIISDFTTYLLPNSRISGDFIFSINNIKYTCTIPSDKEFSTELNKEYTLNFNIEYDGSENTFIASFSIWEDGGEITGKLQ